MIDEAEIARLRAMFVVAHPEDKATVQNRVTVGLGAMPALLDELDRLRTVVESTRLFLSVGARVDNEDVEAIRQGLDMLMWPLVARAEEAERERDEARAACAAKDEGLRALYNWTFRPCDNERLYGTRESTHAAYGVAITADAGRPILDALKQAEEALRRFRSWSSTTTKADAIDAALITLEGLRR